MTRAVLDTTVVVSAIFWPRSSSHRVLASLALRLWEHWGTTDIFGEYERVLAREAARHPGANWRGPLLWLRQRSKWTAPAPLGKPVSRDASDDPFLACGLAAQAQHIVSRDHDLLDLGRPFGIIVCGPETYLRHLRSIHRPNWPF